MSVYRLCVIDDAGHVVDRYEPECGSDEEAYHTAERLLGGGRAIDIWEGERWIAWLDGGGPLADRAFTSPPRLALTLPLGPCIGPALKSKEQERAHAQP